MADVFIIHGAYGSPGENWIPWLKRELEQLDCRVFAPQFPTPEKQTLENWMRVFAEYDGLLNKDSVVIGHSLGVAFLLTLLEKSQAKAAFFISGFIGLLNNPSFDKINKTFTYKKFDWDLIRQNCNKFYVFHSDNDPYVPLEKAKELAKPLSTDIILIKGGGHLNRESGYIKFELLLNKIKGEI